MAAPPTGSVESNTYLANNAALEHQRNNSIAEIEANESLGQKQFGENMGALQRNEPIALRGYLDKENASGVLQSGRAGTGFENVQIGYAQKEQGERTKREGEAAKNAKAKQVANETYADKSAQELKAAEEGYAKEQVARAPEQVATTAASKFPLAQAYVNQQFPGGINEQRAWIKRNAAEKAAGRK